MASYATILSGLLLIGSSAHAQSVQVARSLPGFQCNALVHVWNGHGPMPPSVPEFAGPEQSARRVGIAMSTVIVDDPPKTAEGRTRILRPNGSFAWIESSEIGPWRAASAPAARCSAVQMTNGTYGTFAK
jgi:hypothetical protein